MAGKGLNQFFERKARGEKKAKCTLCRRSFVDKNGHLKTKHPEQYQQIILKKDRKSKKTSATPNPSTKSSVSAQDTALVVPGTSQNAFQNNASVGNNLSRLLNSLKSRYLLEGRRVALVSRPQINSYSSASVTTSAKAASGMEQLQIELDKQDFVSLSTKKWRNGSEIFRSLKVQFINCDWQLRSAVIKCYEYNDDDDATPKLDEIIEAWKIRSKIVALVVENDDSIIDKLAPLDLLLLTCAAHALPSGVRESIPQDLQSILQKAHDICTFSQQAPPVEPEVLVLDSLSKYKNESLELSKKVMVLDKFIPTNEGEVNEGDDLHLSQSDRAALIWFLDIMKPLEEFSKDMRSTGKITISQMPAAERLLQEAIKYYRAPTGESEALFTISETLAKPLWDKLHGDSGILATVAKSPMVLKAAFLDPRFKNKLDDEEISSLVEELKKEKTEHGETQLQTHIDPNSFWEKHDKEYPQEVKSAKIANEVAGYKSEVPIPRQEDPLLWWKSNAEKYPLLAKFARKYLCLPAATIQEDEAFTEAALANFERWMSMDTENVENIIPFLEK